MIHPLAHVSPRARLGARVRIWHAAQIGDGAEIGDDCIIGSNVYIDRGVIVGSRVKIQTGAQLYRGTRVEDGVFIGPSACVTNDLYPRAIALSGELKTDSDWSQGTVRLAYGASLGAGSIVLPNTQIGRFAMVAAGAVVTADVTDYGLVVGIPARLCGYVCQCGGRLLLAAGSGRQESWQCRICRSCYRSNLELGFSLQSGPLGDRPAETALEPSAAGGRSYR